MRRRDENLTREPGQPFTYWHNVGDPGELWHVGRYGPRYIVQGSVEDVISLVAALNAALVS